MWCERPRIRKRRSWSFCKAPTTRRRISENGTAPRSTVPWAKRARCGKPDASVVEPYLGMVHKPYGGAELRMGSRQGSAKSRETRRIVYGGPGGIFRSAPRYRRRPGARRSGASPFLLREGCRRGIDGAFHVSGRTHPHFWRRLLAEGKKNL